MNQELLELHDGPTLQVALQKIAGRSIRYPKLATDAPDRELLAERFEQFRNAA